jgi:hypothetical protein
MGVFKKLYPDWSLLASSSTSSQREKSLLPASSAAGNGPVFGNMPTFAAELRRGQHHLATNLLEHHGMRVKLLAEESPGNG